MSQRPVNHPRFSGAGSRRPGSLSTYNKRTRSTTHIARSAPFYLSTSDQPSPSLLNPPRDPNGLRILAHPRLLPRRVHLIDPFFCALGIATYLFTKNDVIAGLSPAAVVPPRAEIALLLDFLAGFFAMLGCLQVSLLRARPSDVPVWRALQASTLVLDVVMTAATARKLLAEGRTDPSVWLGGEWQNLAGNEAIGAVRAAFVLGVGMGGAKGKTA